MSPLWPDFAIACAARAAAVEQGLIDRTERPEPQPRAPWSRRWPGQQSYEIVRRPLRRPITSYAL
jgi:hypothetical protein